MKARKALRRPSVGSAFREPMQRLTEIRTHYERAFVSGVRCAGLKARLSCTITGAAILVGNCTSGQIESAAAVVTDSANTRIITNRDSRWRTGEEWVVMPQPLTTIGVLEGNQTYEFHEISDAAAQSDGDIVVADAGSGSRPARPTAIATHGPPVLTGATSLPSGWDVPTARRRPG
jgi:hypothetical protein